MMKRKILAVVLPIVGCATVVGSGFSAWYFGTMADPVSNGFDIGLNVTEEVKSSSLTIIDSNNATLDSLFLVLDQGGQQNKTNLNAGIMLGSESAAETIKTDEMDWSFKVKYNADDAEGISAIPQLYEAGYRIRFTTTITLTENLSKYVQLTPNAEGTAYGSVISLDSSVPTVTIDDPVFQTNDSGKTYVAEHIVDPTKYTNASTATWDFLLKMDTNASYVNELFTYKQKPSTPDAYQKMVSDLTGEQSVSFSFVAAIEVDPAKAPASN